MEYLGFFLCFIFWLIMTTIDREVKKQKDKEIQKIFDQAKKDQEEREALKKYHQSEEYRKEVEEYLEQDRKERERRRQILDEIRYKKAIRKK